MNEIHGKSILVRVSARFELSGVDCIVRVRVYYVDSFFSLFYVTGEGYMFLYRA